MGKGTAHIISLTASCLHKLLELGNDSLPASSACVVNTVTVVNLLASVKAQNNVGALAVGEIDNVIVDKHTVGGESEAEILLGFLLNASGISNKLLDYVKIHKRLATEEIDLKIVSCAGIFNKEIKGSLSDLEAHKRSVAVILALTCKAIGAVKVAGVSNM